MVTDLAKRFFSFFLCISLFLVGCQIPPNINDYPITDGFHTALPKKESKIVLWGGDPIAANTAMNWIQKQQLVILERAGLNQILQEHQIKLTQTQEDNAQILKVAKLVGADQVVFLETSISQTTRSTHIQGMEGAFPLPGRGRSFVVYEIGVSIRGVDPIGGRVLWNGSARYSGGGREDLNNGLVNLTCQALATAWGFRPNGQHLIDSQTMCEGKPFEIEASKTATLEEK